MINTKKGTTMLNADSKPWVEVAIGLLIKEGKVCLTLRQSHQHLAGHWEFPGGKIEQNETPQHALTREFKEELGVDTFNWQPLITVPWHYENVSVRLHVFQTEAFSGQPQGLEGQQVEWCPVGMLSEKHFPEANKGILTALALPTIYMKIGAFKSEQACLNQFNQALKQGVKLAQLNSKGFIQTDFIRLANQLADAAMEDNAQLMLSAPPEWLAMVPNAAGLQLSSKEAQSYDSRPISENKWLAISTHNQQQVEHALTLGADIILISPVNTTKAHPDLEALGWQGLQSMIAEIPVPVFGLGGMRLEDASGAVQYGAQGVMLTKGVWPE